MSDEEQEDAFIAVEEDDEEDASEEPAAEANPPELEPEPSPPEEATEGAASEGGNEGRAEELPPENGEAAASPPVDPGAVTDGGEGVTFSLTFFNTRHCLRLDRV